VAYTAETLAALMVTELGPTGVALSLTDDSDAITEAVAEVAAILGVDDVADLTDDLKTRTLARWQAWRTAKGAATGQYDLTSDEGGVIKRSQLFDHIVSMLADAEAAASRYDEAAAVISGGSVATVTSSSVAGSPYAWHCPGGW
jgi:hypothetical protein